MASILSRTARGGAGFVAANFINKFAGLVFVLVASRMLGVAQYGAIALALSVVGVVQSLTAFGLPIAAQRFLSGDGDEESPQLMGGLLVAGGVMTLISTAVFFAAAPWIATNVFSDPGFGPLLRTMSLTVFFAVPYLLMKGILQAQEKVGWIVRADTLQRVCQIGLAVSLFYAMGSVFSFAWAIVVSFGLAACLALGFMFRLDVKPSFTSVRPALPRLFGVAAPSALVGFSYLLAQQTDKLMLGAFIGQEAVGLYAVAVSVAMLISVFHSSLVSIFMPLASEAFRNDDAGQVQVAFLFVSKWLGAIGGLLLLTFVGFGPWMLGFFGAAHTGWVSYQVLMLLGGLYFLGTWTGPTGALLLMTDRQRAEMVNTVIFIVLNLTLNYLLIPRFGLVGAAVATMTSALIRKAIQVLQIIRWHGVQPFERSRFYMLFIVAGTLALCLWQLDVPSVRAGLAMAGMLALAACALLTSEPEERRMLVQLKSKIALRIR